MLAERQTAFQAPRNLRLRSHNDVGSLNRLSSRMGVVVVLLRRDTSSAGDMVYDVKPDEGVHQRALASHVLKRGIEDEQVATLQRKNPLCAAAGVPVRQILEVGIEMSHTASQVSR